MNFYQLQCTFIENEASFSVDEIYLSEGGFFDYSENYVRFYDAPPIVWVDKVYKERNMSDILKAIGFIPHKKVVDALSTQAISGIQFIPVIVDVDDVKFHDYFFMNVCARYPILDVISSQARDEHLLIDNAFEYVEEVILSAIKLTKTPVHHDIFRVSEYPDEIFVTEKVKIIFEFNQFTGLKCVPVEVR